MTIITLFFFLFFFFLWKISFFREDIWKKKKKTKNSRTQLDTWQCSRISFSKINASSHLINSMVTMYRFVFPKRPRPSVSRFHIIYHPNLCRNSAATTNLKETNYRPTGQCDYYYYYFYFKFIIIRQTIFPPSLFLCLRILYSHFNNITTLRVMPCKYIYTWRIYLYI